MLSLIPIGVILDTSLAVLAGINLHRALIARYTHMGFGAYRKNLIKFITYFLASIFTEVVIWFAR